MRPAAACIVPACAGAHMLQGRTAMAYFVTGATGFIGRFLVGHLLARGEPVYVLVRRGSQKKLDALRERHGATDRQIVGVTGDLAKPRLGLTDADVRRLKGK